MTVDSVTLLKLSAPLLSYFSTNMLLSETDALRK